MKIIAWVDVYPWNLNDPNGPYITVMPPSSPPNFGGKRYRLEFEVPDPVPVDGDAKVLSVTDGKSDQV